MKKGWCLGTESSPDSQIIFIGYPFIGGVRQITGPDPGGRNPEDDQDLEESGTVLEGCARFEAARVQGEEAEAHS